MPATYRAMVFGNAGCDKCKVLQARVDDLLAGGEWTDFEKTYADVETEDGMVAFCRAECINPQRIPAVVVLRRDDASGRYEPIARPEPGRSEAVGGESALYHVLGLQTDYSDKGRGVISPKMIASLFAEARRLAPAASAPARA